MILHEVNERGEPIGMLNLNVNHSGETQEIRGKITDSEGHSYPVILKSI